MGVCLLKVVGSGTSLPAVEVSSKLQAAAVESLRPSRTQRTRLHDRGFLF